MTLLLDQGETWSAEEIEESVCDILAQILERPAGTIQRGALPEQELGVDSLALLQTQIGIEDHFGVVTSNID